METQATMPTPKGLKAAGRALFRDVAAAYALRADEQRLLAEAARTLDELTRLEEALADEPVLVTGSTGQPRPHPLIAEVRGHRGILLSLLRQLGLPDLAEGVVPVRSALSEKRSRAAHARWERRRALAEAASEAEVS